MILPYINEHYTRSFPAIFVTMTTPVFSISDDGTNFAYIFARTTCIRYYYDDFHDIANRSDYIEIQDDYITCVRGPKGFELMFPWLLKVNPTGEQLSIDCAWKTLSRNETPSMNRKHGEIPFLCFNLADDCDMYILADYVERFIEFADGDKWFFNGGYCDSTSLSIDPSHLSYDTKTPFVR